MIVRKSRAEIEKMRLAGQVVADVHKMLQDIVVPGVTTAELDKKAEALIRSRGADPTFKGYRVGREVFPATLCVSVNEEIVHGIPGSRVLEEGDLLSVDCGATLSGYVGDSAISLAVGRVSQEVEELMERTKASLYAGINMARPGNRIGDIGHAVSSSVAPYGYGVVQDFCGHGVGRRLGRIATCASLALGAAVFEGLNPLLEPHLKRHPFHLDVEPVGLLLALICLIYTLTALPVGWLTDRANKGSQRTPGAPGLRS